MRIPLRDFRRRLSIAAPIARGDEGGEESISSIKSIKDEMDEIDEIDLRVRFVFSIGAAANPQNRIGIIRIARMFTTLIMGLMAGPAVSL